MIRKARVLLFLLASAAAGADNAPVPTQIVDLANNAGFLSWGPPDFLSWVPP